MTEIAFTFQPKGGKKNGIHNFKDSPLIPVRRADGMPVTIRNFKDGECRWPYGAPGGDMLMCGRPTVCAPYCAEHRKAAYQPSKPMVR